MCALQSNFVLHWYLCLALTLLLAPAELCAQQSPRMLHVELVVHPTTAADAPTLTQRDVRVEVNGARVKPTLTDGHHDAGQTHVLVVAQDAAASCTEWTRSRWARTGASAQWSMTFTNQAANVAVALGRGGCGPISVTMQSALQTLRDVPGRRVVLLLSPLARETASALQQVPEVYVVDGGVSVTRTTPPIVTSPRAPAGFGGELGPVTLPCWHPAGSRVVPNDLCNVGTTTTSQQNGFAAGVNHQKALPDAIRAIASGAKDYYDLAIPYRAPSGAAVPVVALQFRHVPAFSGSADAYLEDTGTASSRTRSAQELALTIQNR